MEENSFFIEHDENKELIYQLFDRSMDEDECQQKIVSSDFFCQSKYICMDSSGLNG